MKTSTRNIRAAISRWTDLAIVLPLLLFILLGIIWNGIFVLIQVERDNARNDAARISVEQLHTYEAQMVRVLREIDQSLKIVKHTYENGNHEDVLDTLNAQGL